MAVYEINAPPGSHEFIITRIFNAPRGIVFKTVTDPLLVPQWWGPRWFTTKVIKMVAMPGGTWRYIQTDKEGKEYGFHGVYHDVIIPERLIYTMEYDGMPGHVTLVIDKFTEQDGRTIMTSTTIFQSVEDRDQMLQWGMEEGTTETTNRLNELLSKDNAQERKEEIMTHHSSYEGNGKSLTITRIFDAPRERVWQRWTEPEQFSCWWGPKDFTAPYTNMDLRIGGKYLYCMRSPDGKDYWGTGIYKEISEPNRIVYTDSFADEHGNVVSAAYYGMDSEIPLEMEVEVTLEDIGGKTRMTLEHYGFPQGEMHEQAKAGWNESFDKLVECLG